jgi:subtilisin family serine protease
MLFNIRKLFTVIGTATLLVLSISSVGAAGPGEVLSQRILAAKSVGKSDTGLYIIVMAQEPVIAYDGGIQNYPATKPGKGGKINPNSAHVRKYSQFLKAGHDQALQSVGLATSDKMHDYTIALNGFAARMTEDQANRLTMRRGVTKVFPDEIRHVTTDNSPDFLDLTAIGGPLEKGIDGEDVVIGVIDTGIWPEHPSFADDGTYGPAPASFTGIGCDFGNTSFNPDDTAFTCNNKLLAAKSFGAGFHGGTGVGLASGSYNSARDEDGHGTHTTSTAGGNSGVSASILGADRGTVSGIAPRARVSMYKACWQTSATTGGCALSDLTGAIDAAVMDGVDVINYSIGSSSSAIGADDIAFLFADNAGVFVATSNGNSGPGPATTGSPASVPWLTSVGASTQDRTFQGSASSSDGWEYFGASVTGGTTELPLVDAADAGDPLCNPGALNSAVVSGNIVLCQRGAIARVAKSQAVSLAGGAGMILFNNSDFDTQNTDNHDVPSVHVNNTDGLAVKAYIAGATSPVAMINGGVSTPISAPWVAAFSSRGPNTLASDLIKPDVTAPGVNILAGNSPTALLGAPGQMFQAISGTSMSSPHVAGVFALLKQAHPDWSPAAAKSALMTTAYQDVEKEDGVTPADPFDIGAGHINPGGEWSKGSADEPGLAYDAGLFEYAAFTCGADLDIFTPGSCDFLEAIGIPFDGSDLNLPSIGVGELVGVQTVKRTVTSVAKENGNRTYTVSVDAPPGYTVGVSPSKIKLKRGQTADYYVTITNVSAALGEWAFGSLTWDEMDGKYSVRSPIALRGFEFAAADEINASGTSGSASFDVQFGYTGTYSAAPHGLIQATETANTVVDDPANDINTALGTGVGVNFEIVTVPAGTAHTRFSLFDAYTDGNDDLDLYVFGPDTAGFPFMGGSGSGTSEEQVDLEYPAAGLYIAVVHGWETDGPDANYTLFDWSVPVATGGSLVIDSAPASAALGATESIDVSWSGLTGGTKYLGAVSHSDGSGILGLTLVDVATD